MKFFQGQDLCFGRNHADLLRQEFEEIDREFRTPSSPVKRQHIGEASSDISDPETDSESDCHLDYTVKSCNHVFSLTLWWDWSLCWNQNCLPSSRCAYLHEDILVSSLCFSFSLERSPDLLWQVWSHSSIASMVILTMHLNTQQLWKTQGERSHLSQTWLLFMHYLYQVEIEQTRMNNISSCCQTWPKLLYIESIASKSALCALYVEFLGITNDPALLSNSFYNKNSMFIHKSKLCAHFPVCFN